jgi:hypothetical protein
LHRRELLAWATPLIEEYITAGSTEPLSTAATLAQVGLLVVPPAARLEAPQDPGPPSPRGDGLQPPASHEPGAQ